MKLLKKIIMVFVVLSMSVLCAKTLTVNDQILHWTPKMIEHIKTAHDLVDDADLKQEAQLLLTEWNSFKNNLSARKSNQKVFLQMSRKNEAFLKRVNTYLIEHDHRVIQTMLHDLYVAQQKVRGKKD